MLSCCLPIYTSGRQQDSMTILRLYIQFISSWWWAEKPPEACRALIIIKNIVYIASRWLYKIHIWRKSYSVTNAAHCRQRIETNALRYACNWPAWHFVVWRLLLCFILKMEVACSSKMCVYVCQTTWSHMREDAVFFCALGISNFVTCPFSFGAEEILTSAQYPSSGTSHGWLSMIAYWMYV